MAGKKKAGRVSAPPNRVEAALVGRMIRRLQTYTSGAWWHHPGRRCFTDKEIMAAFGLTKAQFDACLEARKKAPPRIWDSVSARKAFNDFVRTHKRWPRAEDYRNWRETGLPSRNSLAIWCGGEWNLIERWARSHFMTTEMVLTIPNITVRRNAIARYGINRLILNGGGENFQQDDFGSLWRLPSDGVDPRMVYVEVVNKTPQMNEETGEYVTDKKGDFVYDHYFLRVPPNTRTAKDAVAWTFSLSSHEFVGFAAES